MVFTRKSRRMFLRGAGGMFLAAPFLPSLLPRTAAAEPSSPRRYVQFLSQWGNYHRADLVPDIKTRSPQTPNGVDDCLYLETGGTAGAPARALLAANAVSKQFAPELLPYLSFVRGLNAFKTSHMHNASLASTASFPRLNNDNNQAEIDSHPFPSIDWLIQQKIYEPSFQGPRAARVLLGMAYNRWYGSWSWGWNAGKSFRVEPSTTLQALWNSTFGKFTTGGAPDPTALLHKSATDLVLEDYQRIATHRRISSDDRDRLNQYMDLMRNAEGPGLILGASCTKPGTPIDDPNWRVKHQRAIDLVLAAMACDVTRVASIQVHQTGDGMGYNYNLVHPWSHNDGTNVAANMRAVTGWRGALSNYLLKGLLNTKDGAGRPLLDSTVFYMGNEFGPVNSEGMNEGNDIPVVVGGGASTRMKTGLILDYVMRPYNNLLATLAYGMGLGAADFELPTQPGFGIYRRATRTGPEYAFAAASYDKYGSTDARRAALPMLLKSV
jgi:hypothetical protein